MYVVALLIISTTVVHLSRARQTLKGILVALLIGKLFPDIARDMAVRLQDAVAAFGVAADHGCAGQLDTADDLDRALPNKGTRAGFTALDVDSRQKLLPRQFPVLQLYDSLGDHLELHRQVVDRNS